MRISQWRHTAVFVVGIAAVAGIAACSGSPSAEKSSDQLRVALNLPQASPYAQAEIEAAKKWATENNVKLDVIDSGVDSQKQYNQMQDMIAQGKYDGIAVAPLNGPAMVPLVGQAKAAGTSVVAVTLPFSADLTGNAPLPAGLAGLVWQPPTETGRWMGKQFKEACETVAGQCRVAYLAQAPQVPVEAMAIDKMKEEVQDDPRIEFVGVVKGGLTRVEGTKATQDLLQAHPDINVIGAVDPLLFGAEVALKTSGRSYGTGPNDIRLVGDGATITGIQRVVDGNWMSTMTTVPANEATMALDILLKAMRGNLDEPVNIKDSVVRSGFPEIMNKQAIEKSGFKGQHEG